MSAPTDKVSPQPDAGSQPEQSPSLTEGTEGSWQATVIRDIMIGQRLGEYVVRRRIGAGGMGVVYEGEHPVIGRKVAIKIIRSDSSEGARARDLVAEARATSSIRHRGIIDIFGFGTLPGIGQYLVMEFLTGQPLDEVMLDRLPMPLPEALRLVIEILGALSAAHGMGVIHRDLKPGNIFVVRESNGAEYVKILDFGLAKQAAAPHGATPQTRTSIVLGTPEYMAPEQACGQPVSPRTDLYAVGTLLFELVTGRLPFKGDSPMHVAIQQVHSPPPAPSSFVQGLPAELEALILSLLAKAPEQRPQSAERVAQELTVIGHSLQPETFPLLGAIPRLAGTSGRVPSVAAPPPETDRLSATPSGVGSNATVLSRTMGGQTLVNVPTVKMDVAPSSRVVAMRRVGTGLGMLLLVGGGVLLGMHRAAEPVQPLAVTEADVAVPTPPAPKPAAPRPAAPKPSLPKVVPMPPELVDAPTGPTSPVTEPVVQRPPAVPPAPQVGGEPPRAASGSLQIVSGCWAYVYIDGVRRGRTPMQAINLPVGAHTLELKHNPAIRDQRGQLFIRRGVQTEFQALCRPLE